MSISVFYPSLKVMVKIVGVNMKSGTMNVVFVTISLLFSPREHRKTNVSTLWLAEGVNILILGFRFTP